MNLVIYIFGSLASLFHLLFFYLESLAWLHPKVNAIFRMTAEQAQATKLLAFNRRVLQSLSRAGPRRWYGALLQRERP